VRSLLETSDLTAFWYLNYEMAIYEDHAAKDAVPMKTALGFSEIQRVLKWRSA